MKRGIELEWIVVDDNQNWSPVHANGHRQPKRQRPRAILTLMAILAALIGAAFFLTRHRLDQQQQQLKAEFQTLIDLQARAIANSDRELYLTLLDQGNSAWFNSQKNTLDFYMENPRSWPQVQVTHVEIVDDYAWVSVVATQATSAQRFKWIHFFRWEKNGWRLSAPDPRFWGELQTQIIGPLHIIYYERDERYIRPIASELTEWVTSLCADLGCPDDLALTVRLNLPYPHTRTRSTRPDVIELPSPAAWPQPPSGRPNIPALGFQYDIVARYIAFESAGGRNRWANKPDGGWLIHAAADWAQERAGGSQELGPRFQAEQGRGLLRLAVRNAQLGTLADFWHSNSFPHSSYSMMVQHSARYVDLDSAKARAVIDYVDDIYGRMAVAELMHAIGHQPTLDAVLQETLGIGLEQFEADWHTWLSTYYGFGKGWRLAEAVDYWRHIQMNPILSFFRDEIERRQYRELMRMAVRENRIMSLEQLWSGSGDHAVASAHGGTLISISKLWVNGLEIEEYSEATLWDSRQAVATISATAPPLIGNPNTWRSAHALAVVEYIAAVYSKDAALDLPQAIVRNDTLDAALQDLLGVGLDEFESGWHTWLEARFLVGADQRGFQNQPAPLARTRRQC